MRNDGSGCAGARRTTPITAFWACHPTALVAQGAEANGLFRLPLAWIETVAGIEKVGPMAKKWAATEEFQLESWKAKDAAEIIESLRGLAKKALAESKGMFLWINM